MATKNPDSKRLADRGLPASVEFEGATYDRVEASYPPKRVKFDGTIYQLVEGAEVAHPPKESAMEGASESERALYEQQWKLYDSASKFYARPIIRLLLLFMPEIRHRIESHPFKDIPLSDGTTTTTSVIKTTYPIATYLFDMLNYQADEAGELEALLENGIIGEDVLGSMLLKLPGVANAYSTLTNPAAKKAFTDKLTSMDLEQLKKFLSIAARRNEEEALIRAGVLREKDRETLLNEMRVAFEKYPDAVKEKAEEILATRNVHHPHFRKRRWYTDDERRLEDVLRWITKNPILYLQEAIALAEDLLGKKENITAPVETVVEGEFPFNIGEDEKIIISTLTDLPYDVRLPAVLEKAREGESLKLTKDHINAFYTAIDTFLARKRPLKGRTEEDREDDRDELEFEVELATSLLNKLEKEYSFLSAPEESPMPKPKQESERSSIRTFSFDEGIFHVEAALPKPPLPPPPPPKETEPQLEPENEAGTPERRDPFEILREMDETSQYSTKGVQELLDNPLTPKAVQDKLRVLLRKFADEDEDVRKEAYKNFFETTFASKFMDPPDIVKEFHNLPELSTRLDALTNHLILENTDTMNFVKAIKSGLINRSEALEGISVQDILNDPEKYEAEYQQFLAAITKLYEKFPRMLGAAEVQLMILQDMASVIKQLTKQSDRAFKDTKGRFKNKLLAQMKLDPKLKEYMLNLEKLSKRSKGQGKTWTPTEKKGPKERYSSAEKNPSFLKAVANAKLSRKA